MRGALSRLGLCASGPGRGRNIYLVRDYTRERSLGFTVSWHGGTLAALGQRARSGSGSAVSGARTQLALPERSPSNSNTTSHVVQGAGVHDVRTST